MMIQRDLYHWCPPRTSVWPKHCAFKQHSCGTPERKIAVSQNKDKVSALVAMATIQLRHPAVSDFTYLPLPLMEFGLN